MTTIQGVEYDEVLCEWKPIIVKDIKTNYEISDLGEVRDVRTNEIKNTNLNRKGYPIISLYIPELGTKTTKSIHRLVAENFIPNPENKPQVNHIDGNKLNNHVSNLEWVTTKENIQHAFNTGLRTIQFGENSNASKYTNDQVHQVCKLLEENSHTNIDIAQITSVSVDMVSKIKCKECWIEISSQYNIPEVKSK